MMAAGQSPLGRDNRPRAHISAARQVLGAAQDGLQQERAGLPAYREPLAVRDDHLCDRLRPVAAWSKHRAISEVDASAGIAPGRPIANVRVHHILNCVQLNRLLGWAQGHCGQHREDTEAEEGGDDIGAWSIVQEGANRIDHHQLDATHKDHGQAHQGQQRSEEAPQEPGGAQQQTQEAQGIRSDACQALLQLFLEAHGLGAWKPRAMPLP
mmetsp:Transcript_98429/g.234337  ORF Transcript_98429/g.234337 Transcript_98429/m.234337 type:complete len:211 (+) Transcript_98429:502-1134(+)